MITMNYIIELELPDGMYWYGGLHNNPDYEKKGMTLPMILWSPYFEDAKEMDILRAEDCKNNDLKDIEECKIVAVEDRSIALSRDIGTQGECIIRARYLQPGNVFVECNVEYKVGRRDNDKIYYAALSNADRSNYDQEMGAKSMKKVILKTA